ncbi:hypothetical protein B1U44_28600 [Klebsiella pneumoniae subsp. pneumoniae]|nr:hypothetical protein B1U44_28600 [Klebsiella pneumoniae subsp. pneumoniae]
MLTGEGEKAFCAGGDQKVRGDYGGYQDDSGVHHLNVLDFQRQIRTARNRWWRWWPATLSAAVTCCI